MIIFFLIFVGKRVKLLKRIYQVTQVNSCGILCSRETLSSQSSTFLSVHSSSSHVLCSLGGFSQQLGGASWVHCPLQPSWRWCKQATCCQTGGRFCVVSYSYLRRSGWFWSEKVELHCCGYILSLEQSSWIHWSPPVSQLPCWVCHEIMAIALTYLSFFINTYFLV